MSRFERQGFPRKRDGLRLFALGRIPRCGRCARFQALSSGARDKDQPRAGSLPAVPEFCTYQLCAPLAVRYEALPTSDRSLTPLAPLRVVGGRR